MTVGPRYTAREAVMSEDGRYRYRLDRQWRPGLALGHTLDGRRVLWVMFNPSTADGHSDDATLNRCYGFSRGWGAAGLTVVNLFAWRTHNPKRLIGMTLDDATGPDCDGSIMAALHPTACGIDMPVGLVVMAWGAGPSTGRLVEQRAPVVARLLDRPAMSRPPVMCLGRTGGGQPRHPLYTRADTQLEPFTLRVPGQR